MYLFIPQIHNMMTECWNGDPGLRPTFKKLAQSVDTFRDSEEGWGTLPGGLYWRWPGPAHMITLSSKKRSFSIVKRFATVCPNQYNPDDALTLKDYNNGVTWANSLLEQIGGANGEDYQWHSGRNRKKTILKSVFVCEPRPFFPLIWGREMTTCSYFAVVFSPFCDVFRLQHRQNTLSCCIC